MLSQNRDVGTFGVSEFSISWLLYLSLAVYTWSHDWLPEEKLWKVVGE